MATTIADIVYPYTPRMTGIRRYSERLINGMRQLKAPVKVHRVRKIEKSLWGRPVGGLISQRFFSMFIRTHAPVVHALSPDLSGSKTNTITIHDVIPFRQRELFIRNARERMGYSIMYNKLFDAHLIVQTKVIAAQLVSMGVDPGKIHVCGLSVDPIFKPVTGASPYPSNNMAHIVTVGDFNPRKRFDIIFQAIARVDNVELYHIGYSNSWKEQYARLRKMASDIGRIHFLGAVSDIELVSRLSHADLFAFASMDEGAGYPVAESISCGTNAVVNELDVFKELYDDLVFYSPMDAEGFAETIRYALAHPKPRQVLTQYASSFAPQAEAKRTLHAYEEISDIDISDITIGDKL
ncbi:MAG: glycosyltransferase [Methanomassiliicoccales archaeon]